MRFFLISVVDRNADEKNCARIIGGARGGPVRADSPPYSYHNASLMLVAKSSRVTSITRSRETNKTSFALCLFDNDAH